MTQGHPVPAAGVGTGPSPPRPLEEFPPGFVFAPVAHIVATNQQVPLEPVEQTVVRAQISPSMPSRRAFPVARARNVESVTQNELSSVMGPDQVQQPELTATLGTITCVGLVLVKLSTSRGILYHAPSGSLPKDKIAEALDRIGARRRRRRNDVFAIYAHPPVPGTGWRSDSNYQTDLELLYQRDRVPQQNIAEVMNPSVYPNVVLTPGLEFGLWP